MFSNTLQICYDSYVVEGHIKTHLSLYCISNKDLSNTCNIAHVKTIKSKNKLKNIFFIKKLYI